MFNIAALTVCFLLVIMDVNGVGFPRLWAEFNDYSDDVLNAITTLYQLMAKFLQLAIMTEFLLLVLK